jgi:hypothetical protein
MWSYLKTATLWLAINITCQIILNPVIGIIIGVIIVLYILIDSAKGIFY